MASSAKRMRYVNKVDYECQDESSTEYESYEDDFVPKERKVSSQRPGRKPKCFSRNALLARENRLKKKLYITQLESDVTLLKSEKKKLSTVLDNQSHLIEELRKEVKYLKSVLVNSNDISKLIRNINQSSGMSVSSSLDENLSLNNICIPKLKQPVSRKVPHPWADKMPCDDYLDSTPNFMPSPDQGLCEDFDSDFFNNLDLTFDMPEDIIDVSSSRAEKVGKPFEEHNYTINKNLEDGAIDDVGVCLHVSKHHVSLEFCASCSEKANQARPT